MNFIWLLFAHYIGDIALQSDWQAKNKGKLWYVMLSHCMIWTAIVCIALQFLGIYALWKVLFLLVGHWLCDYWKCQRPPAWSPYIYYDQSWHIVQLVVVFLF